MKISNILLNPQILLVLTVTILHRVSRDSMLAQCELSVEDHNKLYTYSLASPLPKFPHGILSEDGFYKVEANGTVLLFQLCSTMIFNHDPPMCVGCKDCGGPSRCGMGCSALVSNKIDGYPVCTTLGRPSSLLIDVLDKKNPHMGIFFKMSNNGPQHTCSLSVTVMCNSNGVQGPQTFETVGFCDYTTHLKHPSGCAKIISSHGKGFGWFGTLMIIIFCLFGVYLLAGTIYRYLFLHIHGIDAIPNLEFWASLPHRVQNLFSRWCGDLEDHHMVTGAPILPLIFDNVIARDYFDQFLICVRIGNSACHCGSISFTSIGLYSTKAICLDRGSSPYPFCWIDLTLEGTFTTVCEMSIIQLLDFICSVPMAEQGSNILFSVRYLIST